MAKYCLLVYFWDFILRSIQKKNTQILFLKKWYFWTILLWKVFHLSPNTVLSHNLKTVYYITSFQIESDMVSNLLENFKTSKLWILTGELFIFLSDVYTPQQKQSISPPPQLAANPNIDVSKLSPEAISALLAGAAGFPAVQSKFSFLAILFVFKMLFVFISFQSQRIFKSWS